jgi:hypothetical protein
MMAALLLLPASALANDSVSVSAGLLTYTSGDGTRDAIWVTDGNGKKTVVTDFLSPSGMSGANCTPSGVSAECTGATSVSLSTRDANDSVVVFSALPATIDGGAGDDRLTGGPAGDTISGGDGADVVEARDGSADTIDCGPGLDRAFVDAVDVVTNCNDPLPADAPVEPAADPEPPPVEQPTLPEVPTVPEQLPGDPGALPPLALLPVTIEQEVVRVARDGTAELAVSCAAFEAGGCTGTVYLDPAPRAARKGAPRAVAARRGRYGRGRFDVAAGKKARLRMSLSSAARRRLGLSSARKKARAARRGRRVKAQVTVVQRGKKPVKSNVTLKS